MVIREMSREECLRALAGTRVARLGCALGNQPYVVPVSLAYHKSELGEPCLYGVTTPGQKIEWMRANPLVCVEVDEVVAHDRWVSVIVFGRYEELPETPGHDDAVLRAEEASLRVHDRSAWLGETTPERPANNDERLRAYGLLKAQVWWWEPVWAAWLARAHRDPPETYKIIYYKIWIDRVTGHESTREPKAKGFVAAPASTKAKWVWLRWPWRWPARRRSLPNRKPGKGVMGVGHGAAPGCGSEGGDRTAPAAG